MGVRSTRISVLLSGAPNDDEVLQTSLLFAARERCELHVILTDTFPKGTFLRHLDVATWEAVKRGLATPQVSVERKQAQAEPLRQVRAS